MKVTKITIELEIELANDLISAFDKGIIDYINVENPYHAKAFGELEDILRPHKTSEGREE